MARFSDHLIDLAPLRRNRAFRLLYGARLSSLLSYGILTVALGVQAYDIVGTSVAVATLMAVSALSMAASLLAGGVLADRADRRRIVVASRTVYLLAIAALIANSLSPSPALWPMMIAALIAGLTSGISLPAPPPYSPCWSSGTNCRRWPDSTPSPSRPAEYWGRLPPGS